MSLSHFGCHIHFSRFQLRSLFTHYWSIFCLRSSIPIILINPFFFADRLRCLPNNLKYLLYTFPCAMYNSSLLSLALYGTFLLSVAAIPHDLHPRDVCIQGEDPVTACGAGDQTQANWENFKIDDFVTSFIGEFGTGKLHLLLTPV